MSAQLRMVLDTNVYVAAVISSTGAPAQLLRLAESRRFRLVASPLLLEELAEVLERPKLRNYFSVDEGTSIVGIVRTLADVVDDPEPTGTAITADPDDDFLVSLTEVANADALVSGDPHLTELNRVSLTVLTPRQALDVIESPAASPVTR